jgi:pimeloyl-ACP methyl ester carboxylesterase
MVYPNGTRYTGDFALAEDLARLLDDRGLDRVVLGGLSLGGYVALAFLRLRSIGADLARAARTPADPGDGSSGR